MDASSVITIVMSVAIMGVVVAAAVINAFLRGGE